MKTKTNFSRRDFIKLSGMTGTVLALGSWLPALGQVAEIRNVSHDASSFDLNAFISIDTTGKVTIVNHRAEMGQGSFQSVPQIIAEELEVNLDMVNIVFASGDERKYGPQTTGGSSTVRSAYKRLGQLGATAREMLIEAAAKKWNVARTECYAENGYVIHKSSGKKFSYGELVEEASRLTPPATVSLKRPDQYKIIRKPMPRQDTPLKVNGKAVFGIDKKLPGMLYAVVERSPRFQGKIKSLDDSGARAISGVKHIVRVSMPVFSQQREGVAVVADNLWAALQGRKALKIEWDDSGIPAYDTEKLYAQMREDLKADGKSISYKTKGNADTILSTAEKKISVLYETPYESHSCMEPINCIAHVKGDTCEIWGPIQGPGWIQQDISQRLGLKPENVSVNMTFLGGGFGRKAFTDYPAEAALISKEINAPVQVVWTREDDMTQGPFRPGMIYQCDGSIGSNGRIQSYKVKMAGQNMDHQWPGADKKSYNDNVTEGFLKPYFDTIPHYTFSDAPLDAPVPVMWWRSVYSSTNGFAFESFMDELAVQAGKDPMNFHREHTYGERYHSLIDKLEQVTNWKARGKNSGYGMAITECFDSIVGEVVKVSKTPEGKIKVDKVWAVMDCGWYVNPDIIRAQVEGSIVMALGAAVKHETHFKDSKAVEKNFDSYKMPRIQDIPDIEVHIMDNNADAGGVGEPGLPPFSAALTNAIFDLTGKRIRKLPFSLDAV